VLAVRAGHVPDGAWWHVLLLVTLATIAFSGGHYVLVRSREAAQQRQTPA